MYTVVFLDPRIHLTRRNIDKLQAVEALQVNSPGYCLDELPVCALSQVDANTSL